MYRQSLKPSIRFRVCSNLLLALAGLGGCAGEERLDQIEQAVVYGEDDREDVFAYADQTWAAEVAGFSAAMIPIANIDLSDPNDVVLLPATTLEDYGLCPEERFGDQIAAAHCGGTLIGPDMVLTAGHCVDGDACGQVAFVFDYAMADESTLQTVTSDDVYRCEEVLVGLVDDMDYAVVRLDREVAGRMPARVSTAEAALPDARSLVVSGYPTGLPLKIAGGARVRDSRPATLDYFVANLDTFTRSFGSGVFNEVSKQLVGVQVRGEDGYVIDEEDECWRVNVCRDEGCSGEDSTYAFRAIAALCGAGVPAAGLCHCGDGTQHCGTGDVCAQATEIEAHGTQRIAGETRSAQDDLAGSCAGSGAPDRVYTFKLTAWTAIDVLAGGFDTGLYLRSDCDDASTEIACNHNGNPPGTARSHIAKTLPPGSYSLIVDGNAAGDAGSFVLVVAFDSCPADPAKTEPGACGCGEADTDGDHDGTPSCLDPCPAGWGDNCLDSDAGDDDVVAVPDGGPAIERTGKSGCSAAGGGGDVGILVLLGFAALLMRRPRARQIGDRR